MPLHPRLQPPTLELPDRRAHSFTLALALTVLAAGFAYAMPRTVLTNADEEVQQDVQQDQDVVLTPADSTQTPTLSTSTPSKKTKEKDETGEDGDSQRTENHGAAVSTAAQCDLDGKAHGEFARSIAHDKDATAAEVEAACAAAQAAAATADDSDDVSHGRDHAKLPKAKLDGDEAEGDHADQESDDEESDDSEDEASAETAADEDDASNGGPPEHAKGGKDKP